MTSHSFFTDLELAPGDPILGLNEAFQADTRTGKVNLGIGVYTNEQGRLPILKAVQQAELEQVQAALPRGYLPIQGTQAYTEAVQALVFGEHSRPRQNGCITTVQTLGGTGALRVGADFFKRMFYSAPPATSAASTKPRVAISTPSWENHRAIFEAVGFEVIDYPYYDAKNHCVDIEGLIRAFESYAPGTLVLLHACCHNPTGVDLSKEQWLRIISTLQARQLVPFLDMAYQGFSADLDTDAQAIRLCAEAGLPTWVANSFSKTFSLYGERVGALSIVTNSPDEAARVLSQVKQVIRSNYSNPPTHGAALVSRILTTPALRTLWEEELTEMRERIHSMRHALVDALKQLGVSHDFDFVRRQCGMFSYSGLSAEQVDRLREAFGFYAVRTGRICIAALNTSNIERVAVGIASVLV